MKKIFVNFKHIFTMVIIAFSLGCMKNNKQEPLIIPINQIPTNQEYLNYPLKSTTWKLLGFADLSDSTFKYAEPQNEFSYKLRFETDSTFTGTSSTNEIFGDYFFDLELGTIEIIFMWGSKRREEYDGELYWESVKLIETYSITEYGLHLYFHSGSQYLLYIPLGH
jgi:hypothetical protein